MFVLADMLFNEFWIFLMVSFSPFVYLYNSGLEILPWREENSSSERILSIALYLVCRVISSWVGIIFPSFSIFLIIRKFGFALAIMFWFLSLTISESLRADIPSEILLNSTAYCCVTGYNSDAGAFSSILFASLIVFKIGSNSGFSGFSMASRTILYVSARSSNWFLLPILL